ncbi:MAG: bifunctional [glutamate--ammonia ligase]-adenylyl-L-tyrosine phosphorylase/[glutamate--ammonia-ligase] adenylyltransferase [Sinobacteraceae bacterium]|nr:bifunctional [glutamate--ammonia ligase]-adenylyl-L-tyrosine phosphorylase/[glutamate--ammonia-ligase] adenylyltransferase [Nevskiaceae bacterium]
MPRLFRASPFVAGIFAREPEWAERALQQGEFERVPERSTAARLHAALANASDEAAFMRALRVFRHRELSRIAFREVVGHAELDETLHALSDLADAACASALDFAARALHSRHGTPRGADGEEIRPIVLGLGKLGGRELNFSSDIDLVFAYTAPGQTDGSVTISNEEYFGRLVQSLTRLLATPTADGFVFRVDTLLRPFGSAGALAVSADAMELYYQQHGREWERYALIKARPVAGDLAAGCALLQRLEPFVYRRYLDFDAIGALRELKALIDREARKRGAEDDLKLGPGGIRELEFMVQLFQLVRGGQDARLRSPQLRPVLAYLGAAGLLPRETAQALDAAYVFLRRCENAIQMYADEQTHRLPQSAQARAALCAALDFEDWEELCAVLDAHRARVRAEFDRLFAREENAAHATEVWLGEVQELSEALRRRGYTRSPEPAAAALVALREARAIRALPEHSVRRLREIVAALVGEALDTDAPEIALKRALAILEAIAGRSTYLALLRESAAARSQMLKLAAASPWIAELLAQSPALFDSLLDPRLAAEAPGREALRAELARAAAGVSALDEEASMNLLRRYRQEMTLRIAAADLSGALPLVQVSDRLTWLAEAIVAQALLYAREQLAAQYGTPPHGDDRNEFAVIAYGKFGGIELGYGSDLDLVFVYDAADGEAPTVGGPRSLPMAQYFLRLAQRVVQLLSAQTVAGRAYEIDLELRPSGRSGLVTVSFSAFARYQRESAWTWEHQALLRARTVAGGERLRAAVEEVRREVLCRPREAHRLKREVREMRARMRAELEQRRAGHFDVKQGEGGLIDAEFLTQYLCLLHAAAQPAVIEYSDNWRQLEALHRAGAIAAEEFQALLAAERAYRGWLHRRALQQEDALADDAAFADSRAAVRALWRRYLEGDS